MAMLRGKEGYPTLKAKAAQTRHLAMFGLVLARMQAVGTPSRPAFSFRPNSRLGGRSGEYRVQIVRVFEGLVGYQEICDRVPFDSGACAEAMLRFLQACESLSHLWREGLADPEGHNKLPFHLRPKSHVLQHLVLDKVLMWGSPNEFHCYGDESFIGGIKTICSMSKHPATLEQTVAKKAVLRAGVEFQLLRQQ